MVTRKASPTHFVAFRLAGEAFNAAIRTIQSELSLVDANYAHICTSSEKMHFTALLLTLATREDESRAIQCIQTISDRLQQNADLCRVAQVEFCELGQFSKSVLYLKPRDDCDGMNLVWRQASLVCSVFQEAGLIDAHGNKNDDDDTKSDNDTVVKRCFSPHATIAKNTRYHSKKGKSVKINLSSLAHLLPTVASSSCSVPSIELLSMAGIDEDGYYHRLASLHIQSILQQQQDIK